ARRRPLRTCRGARAAASLHERSRDDGAREPGPRRGDVGPALAPAVHCRAASRRAVAARGRRRARRRQSAPPPAPPDPMTVTDPTIAQTLRSFIQENFLYMRPDLEYADDDSLLAKGVIDSLGVMEIVGFLEERFEMTVEQDDVTEQNFG